MSEQGLPPGWCWTDLGTLLSRIEAGHSPKAEGRPAGPNENGVLKVSAVSWGEFRPDENKALPREYRVDLGATVRRGDLLISRANTVELVGAVVIVKEDQPNLMLSDKTLRLVPLSPEISTPFLLHALRMPWVRREFEGDATGTSDSMRNLSQGKIRSARIALAPANEQRRIVAELEAVLARSRRAKEALDSVPTLLERYRQSVLAAAFRGDLTRDWREKNPDIEPASKRLERIRIERRRRWEEAELERMTARGKAPKDDRWKDTYEGLAEVDPGRRVEIPSTWAWASVAELTEFVTSGSRGWGDYYSCEGALFLRVGNLDRHTVELDLADVVRVQPPSGAEGERTRIQAGDVLISITADVGMVGVVPEGLGEAYVNQHIALLRVVPEATSRALAYALADPSGLQRIVREVQYGVTKASLSLIQVRGFPVPVLPLAEEAELVRQLDTIFRRVEELEKALPLLLGRHEDLDQSLLNKAFRGELVPQDPSDEAASVLLARIRAARGPEAETTREAGPSTKRRSKRVA